MNVTRLHCITSRAASTCTRAADERLLSEDIPAALSTQVSPSSPCDRHLTTLQYSNSVVLYYLADVKDLAYQEYAVPHQSMSEAYHQSPSTPGRAPPPLQNFLPKPPPVPPPPEQYYAATEICNAGYIPPPPPLSTPPAVRVTSSKPRRPRQQSSNSSPRKYVGP